MQTPSLGRRVVVAGVAAVALLALCLDGLLYFSMRSSLNKDLSNHLDRDVALMSQEALRMPVLQLPDRLASLGVMIRLRDPQGRIVAGAFGGEPVLARMVPLPDGYEAEVAVPRLDADRTMSRLVLLEAILTPLVIVLAVFLLRLIADVALHPLDRIADAARRTAEGHRGERLRPQQPDTRLGQMAAAYDEMLDALEAAVGSAEAAQAQSEWLLERNRRIIETAREAFVALDDAGTIIDWNCEAERIFGWSRAEALGRPVVGTVVAAGPVSEGPLGPFRAADDPEPASRLAGFTASNRAGRAFPARMAVWRTTFGGHHTTSAFIWDITEQLNAQEAVGRLAAVVASAEYGMVSTTLQGIILTWNPAAERMYGYAAGDAVGQDIHFLAPDDRRSETDDVLDSVRRDQQVVRLETVLRCASGTPLDVALTVSPIRDSTGAVCGASWIGRDITEERWIAGKLDTSLRALEHALNEARASEMETRRFLDDAAHQLRAPITNIRACAEGLLLTEDADAKDDLLGALVWETGRAGRLMAGLLRMARLGHDQKLEPVPCDVVALCRAEVEKVQTLQPQLTVGITAPVDTGGRPLLDPTAVTEIVANLLDNASRHAQHRIDLEVRIGTQLVEIVVSDDGPGLAADQVDDAFSRFVSFDGHGGSGLGLPIAREMARAQGGDLAYRNKAFVIELRVPPSAPVVADPPPGAPTLAAPHPGG